MQLLFLMVIISNLFWILHLFSSAVYGKPKKKSAFVFFEIWTVVLQPTFYILFVDYESFNECCIYSATFSPDHRAGIYLLIFAAIFAYVVSVYRKKILAPFAELVINLLLIIGLCINIILCIHLNTYELGPLWPFGNISVIFLILDKLYKNQLLLSSYIADNEIEVEGLIGKISLKIIQLHPLLKYPVLLLLTAPLVILLSQLLVMFGQKPDSLIRAFTDTYKHGFSELDYMCQNVQCGGHFLCSVGANGHKNIVKPIRYGERNGNKIICTRQLLISNAFEELLQEKLPALHNVLRRRYNSIGKVIHRFYYLFEIKFVSDVIYFLMKPLEWLFLLILYTVDRKPENRIARQYISVQHQQEIKKLSSM